MDGVTHAFNHHVSEADAFTLQLERDPSLRATIVAVALFDGPLDWARLTERVDRATRLVPMFRCKLVPTPLRLASPRWVHDPDFDLSWHLRRLRLPESGSDLEAVFDLARTASMDAFDHDRPLWEFTLVEGLEDDRSALILKIHHALTDGIGGIQIAAHVVDSGREAPELGPMPSVACDRAMLPFESILEAVGHDLRHGVDLARGLARAVPNAAVAVIKNPRMALSDALGDAVSTLRMVRPITYTRSPVMRDRRMIRHFETLDVPVEGLKAAGWTVDGTLNDAFVAAIAGGMREYHQAHCACVSQLRVTMPISIRQDGDEQGGNHVTLVRFDLPVGVTDPIARMRIVKDLCQQQRTEPAITHSELIAGALNMLPVAVTGQMLRHVDLLASNVVGFDTTAYIAGAQLDAFYPFGATLGAAANITVMSYRGICHIGINTDAGAVPDPELFMRSLQLGFDEVIDAGAVAT